MKTKLFFLFFALVGLDQLTKRVLPASICNKNIAWNIPVSGVFFYFIWTGIILALIYIFSRSKNYYQKMFLVFIFSGAFSNIIDRVKFGCVIDYIDLKIFPVFNLGDIYITVGIFLLIINILKNKSREATL